MRRFRPSITAWKTATEPLFDARFREADILPTDYLETMARLQAGCGFRISWAEALLRNDSVRQAFDRLATRLVPGSLLHLSLRKRYVLEQVEDALRQGAVTVFNIGAGFDSLCTYLAERHPEVVFYELDLPAPSQRKRNGLEKSGLARDNLRLIPVDLSRVPLPQVLQRLARKPGPSVFVLEGLLMYLAEKDVRGLLRGIADNSAPGSQVVLTHILTDASGRPRLTRLARLSRAAFKAIGEPILWGSEPEALPDFLKACGLQVVEQPTMAEIHTRFTGEAPSRIEDMERFATATMGVARGEKPRTDVD